QEIETFKKQKSAQDERIEMEQAKGTADMQADLARSKVGVDIKKNNAAARVAEAGGEAEFIRQTGTAKGAEVEAIGLARKRVQGASRGARFQCGGHRQRGYSAGRGQGQVRPGCFGRRRSEWRRRLRRTGCHGDAFSG